MIGALRHGWRGGRLSALFVLAFATVTLAPASRAHAVPAFAQQTGQPCEACHVGAFGPQLKPYGRDFKLFGYQSTDHKSHEAPIAATVQASLTHTNTAQTPPAPGFAANDNFAVDQVSLYYAGKVPGGWGAFAQVTYDGVGHGFNLDNVDIRHAKDYEFGDHDLLVAVDFNNNPTVEDAWNSTPAWGYAYNGSALAAAPAAGTLIDGGLGGQVVGGGGYVMLDASLYAAFTLYAPLERQFAGRLGEGTGAGSDRFTGPIPYWRLALVHDVGTKQTFEIGTYGLHAERYPGGVVGHGRDAFTDWAVDGVYQYIGSSRHVVSAHATLIHEDQDLAATSALTGSRPRDSLTTARADLSYSFADTFTPSVQWFSTSGTADPVLYPNGPRTSGYVAELAWSPLGKPNSPVSWFNARVALQYVGYTEFDGLRHGASDNNSVYLSLWMALVPLGWKVQR